MPDPWVSVDNVVRHFGVSKDAIYRRADAKKRVWVRNGGATQEAEDRG